MNKLLIVGEFGVVVDFVADFASKRGYRCSVAQDPYDVRLMLRKGDYDAVLVDCDLGLQAADGFVEMLSGMEHPPLLVLLGVAEEGVLDSFGGMGLRVNAVAGPYGEEDLELALVPGDVAAVAPVVEAAPVERRSLEGFVGGSEVVCELKQMVRKVAATDATLLITGENGSGKEVLAREVFLQSERRDKPYVCVNCGAISETLFESELFGHEKGAFTGATQQRKGHFEAADGGTLVLDEVGELPYAMQVKLLRVLQEREFYRVGGTDRIHVDVRIIALTNRDLEDAMARGEFREDLYYRLNVFPVEVPPLRDRVEDIPLLAEAFLERLRLKYDFESRGFSEHAMERLCEHDWPGNVRELANTVERAVVLAGHEALVPECALGLRFPRVMREEEPMRAVVNGVPEFTAVSAGVTGGGAVIGGAGNGDAVVSLGELERSHILQVMGRTGGNRTHACKILQISPNTLRSKLRDYEGLGYSIPKG